MVKLNSSHLFVLFLILSFVCSVGTAGLMKDLQDDSWWCAAKWWSFKMAIVLLLPAKMAPGGVNQMVAVHKMAATTRSEMFAGVLQVNHSGRVSFCRENLSSLQFQCLNKANILQKGVLKKKKDKEDASRRVIYKAHILLLVKP